MSWATPSASGEDAQEADSCADGERPVHWVRTRPLTAGASPANGIVTGRRLLSREVV